MKQDELFILVGAIYFKINTNFETQHDLQTSRLSAV
jgi:hypothetical protein